MLSAVQFRRVTGVKRKTFEKMVEIVQEAHTKKKAKGGRPNKLSVEDMVLMALEYLREYRTYLQLNVQKKQRRFYSGKKKRHTLKTQIIVDKKKQVVICTNYSNGKRHDFRLFKESCIKIHESIKTLTDTGYQGLQKIHRLSLMMSAMSLLLKFVQCAMLSSRITSIKPRRRYIWQVMG